jgi:hypothetical protein
VANNDSEVQIVTVQSGNAVTEACEIFIWDLSHGITGELRWMSGARQELSYMGIAQEGKSVL